MKEHAARLTVYHLPSYSPDYNPIEFLWRAVKRSATHNRYFPAFDLLLNSVEQALQYLAQHPERVRSLFGLYLKQLAQPLPQAA
jgi:transposase